MLFSKIARQNGSSGFFFDGDKNAPDDSISVSDKDCAAANNLPTGASFDFDSNGNLVVVPAPVLSEAQIKLNICNGVWLRIRSKRDQVKAGGVKVATKWFHTDDASRIQHMALNMMGAAIPANLQWKTMDGSFVTMTQALAGQIFQAVAVLDMQAFVKAEEHRVSMEASSNPANYDFSTGWPKTYAEFVAEQV